MNVFRELVETLREVNDRVHEQNRRLAGVEMRGKVKQVDTAKKKVRVVIGKDPDGQEVLSPWVPYKQTAGSVKLHNPPSVGQVMGIRSETGDVEQGVAEPFWWSDDNQSPSDAEDEHVLTFGDVKVTLSGGGLKFEAGGVSVDVTGAGLTVTGGDVTHNSKDIGATHKHPGDLQEPI